MTSVAFPQPGHEFTHTPSDGSSHHSVFFPTTFDSASSFQMNPLSSHPPRTPRTTFLSSSTYGTEMHGSLEEQEEKPIHVQAEDSIHYDDDVPVESTSRVRAEEVWREMVKTSIGRDKTLKLVQYAIRIYLLFHNVTVRRSRLKNILPGWEPELVKKLNSTAANLSLARRSLLLLNWLIPLTTIVAPLSLPFSPSPSGRDAKEPAKPLIHTFLHAPPPVLLELSSAVADDIYTMARYGLLSERIGRRAGNFADWCWFGTTLVGLVELRVERNLVQQLMQDAETLVYANSLVGVGHNASLPATQQHAEQELVRLERLRRQDYWLTVSRNKLLMDLVFVSYDVFKIQRSRDTVKTFAGLASAVLSSAKLYNRHKTTLAKALSPP